MVFSSKVFIFYFLPVVLLSFYFIRGYISKDASYAWLVLCSFFFYAYWYPPYLILILVSFSLNYVLSNVLWRHRNKALLALIVALNLGMIGYFKYFNFFLDTLNAVLGLHMPNDQIVLPLGISFYTFQQIAYVVEVYRTGERAERFIDYCFVQAFFAQLIAGPIVLHREILPQLHEPKTPWLDTRAFTMGIVFFIFGLFKKVILADNFAYAVDAVFNVAEKGTSVPVCDAWIAAFSYGLQLYFDFSGYSDMAIGLGLMFGVRLPINFFSPYKATSIIEFWRRWHMTMTRFFQEYLYFPLAIWSGRKWSGKTQGLVVLFVTMLLIGLWHGAGWTWVLWGGIQGVLLICNHLWRDLRRRLGVPYDPKHSWLPMRLLGWSCTFILVTLAWVVFRAKTLTGAIVMYKAMFFWDRFILPGDLARAVGKSVMIFMRDHLGVTWGGPALAYVNSTQVLFVIVMIAFVAIMPNTIQFMRYYAEGRIRGISFQQQADRLVEFTRGLNFRPTAAVAVFLAVLLIASFTSVLDDTAKTVFIYFQF